MRHSHTRRNGRDDLSAEIRSLESLVERLKVLNRELAAEPSRAPAAPATGTVDLLHPTGYTTDDAQAVLDYLHQNFGRELMMDSIISDIGGLIYVAQSPTVQRYHKEIKKRILDGTLKGKSLVDAMLALEFMIALHNQNKGMVRVPWTLEYATEGKPWSPNEFDELNGKRGGRVANTLFPRIPQVRALRGLVTAE